MRRDQFDIVCEAPSTTVVIKNKLVDSIWAMRMELAPPHKRNRQALFYPALLEVISKTSEGYEYKSDELDKTAFWKYLQGYHPEWGASRLSRKARLQLKHRFRETIALFHDIAENGMRDPLDVIVRNGNCILYRGNRRLVILKVLKVKNAMVRYAINNSSSIKQP